MPEKFCSVESKLSFFQSRTSKMQPLLLLLITALSLLQSCQAFVLPLVPTTNRQGIRLDATQLLEFVEPETGVTVKLVGAMHYNPTSIKLARETIEELGENNRLGSVIIESCDIRYETSKEMSPILKKILRSEMGAACDAALSYDRPVVLGDQRINITVSRMQSAFKETLVDLVQPIGGWNRIVGNITQAWQDGASDELPYLNAFAFLDPGLLLAAPVSFFKYPLSYLSKSPIPTLAFFSLLFLTDYSGEIAGNDLTWADAVGSVGIATLETVVFMRIILKEILQERNEILADSILEQCRLYERKKRGWFSSAQPSSTSEIMYVDKSNTGANNGKDDRTVVAVLGMAHCNGIKKLLLERTT
jgi:pheromone shutdown protein TraB